MYKRIELLTIQSVFQDCGELSMALLLSMLFVVALVGVDQMTKYYAVLLLKDQPPFVLWHHVFELQYHENDGIAFSMFAGWQWIIIPITILVMVMMFIMLWRSLLNRYFWFRASCVLILAGGIGNLIDRIVFGYVVDFLYFRLINFPVFNFADCCVVIGAALLIVFVLFIYKDDDNAPMRTLLFGIHKKEK